MKPTKFQDRILRKIRFKGLWTPEHQDLFSDYKMMKAVTLQMARPFQKTKLDKVVAIDGAGFLFGALIANKLKVGLILVRKEGTIPAPMYRETFIDYSRRKKALEIKKSALIRRNERLLIVDDWAETGAHIKYTIKLIERFKPNLIGISLLVNEMSPDQRKIFSKYNIKELIDFSKIQKPDW